MVPDEWRITARALAAAAGRPFPQYQARRRPPQEYALASGMRWSGRSIFDNQLYLRLIPRRRLPVSSTCYKGFTMPPPHLGASHRRG